MLLVLMHEEEDDSFNDVIKASNLLIVMAISQHFCCKAYIVFFCGDVNRSHVMLFQRMQLS